MNRKALKSELVKWSMEKMWVTLIVCTPCANLMEKSHRSLFPLDTK